MQCRRHDFESFSWQSTLLGQKGGRRGNKLLHPVHSQDFMLGEEDYELALSVSSCDHSLKTTLLLITNTFFRSKDLKFHWILKTWQRTTLQLAPQTEINFWLSPQRNSAEKVFWVVKCLPRLRTRHDWKVQKAIANSANRVKGNSKRISSNSVGAFHSTQNSENFGWYIHWNGPLRFGPTGIWRCMVHFDRSSFWSVGKKCPFPFDQIVLLRSPQYRTFVYFLQEQ